MTLLRECRWSGKPGDGLTSLWLVSKFSQVITTHVPQVCHVPQVFLVKCDNFSLVKVQLKEISRHPGPYIFEAGLKGQFGLAPLLSITGCHQYRNGGLLNASRISYLALPLT